MSDNYKEYEKTCRRELLIIGIFDFCLLIGVLVLVYYVSLWAFLGLFFIKSWQKDKFHYDYSKEVD